MHFVGISVYVHCEMSVTPDNGGVVTVWDIKFYKKLDSFKDTGLIIIIYAFVIFNNKKYSTTESS